jgi:DNA replication protein DnaC
MTNILGDDTQQQVLALGRLGWPLRRIEAATGVRHETASAYLKAAGIPVRLPRRRGPLPPKPASEVSTDSGGLPAGLESVPPWPPPASRAPTASACEPYRELIEPALGRGRNAMAIWQDLVDDHGFPGRYASVRRFVAKLRGQRSPDAHPVIVTAPGEEGQVDYGDGPMVRHPLTGKYRRPRLFVFTLGYSRKGVRLLTFDSSTRRWAELHEDTFRRLGGAVRVVILDNLCEGVLTPDLYDPTLNPLYRDVLAHYGAVALPCRVGHDPRAHPLPRGDRAEDPGGPHMTLVELQRVLRQLRCSGMAAGLEGRLLQAQAERLAPIDVLSTLVQDELLKRQDRLLERRIKQAAFRDVGKTLDTFEFDFNKKMNRALVFELATGRFITQREDGLFLGRPGTGKSHLAQAIGFVVIQQGHRVCYREAHVLLDELADAHLDGTRKACLAHVTTVPLLILDDLGMRKLPHTAAEDLLEIIMRRYEKASTLITSNRPVDDWGKLLGDTAAAAAFLDRLLHHAHVLTCSPRSWRTRLQGERSDP